MPDENQVKHMQAQTRLLNAQAEAIELDNFFAAKKKKEADEARKYSLSLCPGCGTMKKSAGFRPGPHGKCCAACYKGYLPI